MDIEITKKRLKELREDANLTQQKLSEKLFVDRATIASYEKTGKALPSVEVLYRYADFFNCTTDWILGRTDSKKFKITKNNDIEITHYKDTVINEAAIDLLKKALDKLTEKEQD